MFPITAAQLLSLPEGAAASASQRLPWANGSLLSAKLGPADTAGSAQLLLGGFRLRAQIPPTTPMGDVWLLLINQEMPARFRLLSEAQAMSLLIKILHRSHGNQAQSRSAKSSPESLSAKPPPENGWSRLETGFLPFSADITGDGHNLILRDQRDGSPHVVLNHSASSSHFYIQGRVDLEHLGAVVFTLEGGNDSSWRMRMFAANPQGLSHLRSGFDAWMDDRQRKYTNLDGELLPGLPDNLSALPDDIQA